VILAEVKLKFFIEIKVIIYEDWGLDLHTMVLGYMLCGISWKRMFPPLQNLQAGTELAKPSELLMAYEPLLGAVIIIRLQKSPRQVVLLHSLI
jgi:hypothetical protein